MILKPPRWNISPALVSPEAQSLWKGVAFVAPLWGHAGKGALLNNLGQPLAGANLTAGSTLQWRGTPYGLGVGHSGGSNRFLYQDNFLPLMTSNGTGTGDFTVLVLANPPAEAAISNALSQAVSGIQPRMELFFNTSEAIAASSGNVCFLTRDGNNITAGASGVIDGGYHLFCGTRSGGTLRLYVDNILRDTGTGTIQNIAGTGGGFAIGSRAEFNTTTINAACNIVLAAGWNRALTDAEMQLLARDPFCMFRMAQVSPSLWAAPSSTEPFWYPQLTIPGIKSPNQAVAY